MTRLARESMQTAGYSANSVRIFRAVWNSLETYAVEKGATDFSSDFAAEFLKERYNIESLAALNKTEQTRVRAVDMLSEVLNHGCVVVRRCVKGYVFPDAFKSVAEGYIASRESAGIAAKSVQITKLYIERFLTYLAAHGVSSLSAVDMLVIEGFIRSLAPYGKPTLNHMMRTVRGLLMYAGCAHYLVPRIHYNRRARIPSAYTTEEITRLLAVVDRNSPIGKRDYAFMLSAARLGLRASDICSLSFDNIKWEESRVEIVQSKPRRVLTLPLTDDVGMAIIDYLKNGRPETVCQRVFVKHVPPYGAMIPSSTYTIVSRYFEKSGIPVPQGKKHGPHALRHSLASALLENDVPLPVISEVLGHADTNTTGVYLKIDVENLRKCALPVPFYAEKGKAVAMFVEE